LVVRGNPEFYRIAGRLPECSFPARQSILPPILTSLKKTQRSKVDPMRREPGPTYNSRAMIGACKPFDWIDEVPAFAESSPEYLESINNKWRHLFPN
jgi:hypothetical protein